MTDRLRRYKEVAAVGRIDFKYWGVTFRSNSQRFFATLGYTGTRFLVEGNADARELRVIRDNVECPSISPDERLIAFKSRLPDSRGSRPARERAERLEEPGLAGRVPAAGPFRPRRQFPRRRPSLNKPGAPLQGVAENRADLKVGSYVLPGVAAHLQVRRVVSGPT